MTEENPEAEIYIRTAKARRYAAEARRYASEVQAYAQELRAKRFAEAITGNPNTPLKCEAV